MRFKLYKIGKSLNWSVFVRSRAYRGRRSGFSLFYGCLHVFWFLSISPLFMCIFSYFINSFLIPTLGIQYSLRTRFSSNFISNILSFCFWFFILGLGAFLFGYFEYRSECFANFMFSYLFIVDSFCFFLNPKSSDKLAGSLNAFYRNRSKKPSFRYAPLHFCLPSFVPVRRARKSRSFPLLLCPPS